MCVFGRYKTRNAFTWNVLLVPHPLPPQSKLYTQYSIKVPWSFCKCNNRHDCIHILILFPSSNSSFNSNPSPYLVMMMSQCDSGAATTGRRCGMNGPWPSPPALPSTIRQDAPTPSASEHVTPASRHTHTCFCKTWWWLKCRWPGSFLYTRLKPGLVVQNPQSALWLSNWPVIGTLQPAMEKLIGYTRFYSLCFFLKSVCRW